MTAKRIILGMPLIGDGQWAGGINYQRTVLQLIAGPLADRVSARVIVSPEQATLAQDSFGPWLEVPPIVDARAAGAGMGRRAAVALLTGCDRPFAALMAEHGIDVVFENARFFGARFPVPALAWMPDFQHRHLNHLFSRRAWWKRDIGFRAQALGRRIVLLSSGSAEQDCHRFYPRTKGHTAVARFAPQVDLAAVQQRAGGMGRAHGLSERFFYMPNHFWGHKNHALVAAALRHLRDSRGSLNGIPPVIMSGPMKDYRDPGLFDRVMDTSRNDGLAPWFRHLGLIPFADVLALNAAADAVINPSFFEGWATSVEEAKCLGTPLILSDLPVHREQAPDAAFFDPNDAAALAQCLENAAAATPRRPCPTAQLIAANATRLADFAQSFVAATEAAFALGKAAPTNGQRNNAEQK